MRAIIILLASLFIPAALSAQISIGVGNNIDRQPVWGPTGYDHVEYYYMPDIDSYYSVSQRRFYYYEGGHWVGRAQLPPRFHNYDLYNSYKVVVNDREPYRNPQKYRDQFVSYKGRHDQQPIRDSHDEKYYVNKNHPEHNAWVKIQKHNGGNGNAKGKGNGNGGNKGNKNHGKKTH
jgi:hypothetical protein